MQALFSETGKQRLDEIVQPGVLCAFDFDGTLAPIVTQPETVHLPPDILQRLISLSRFTPVAIITGRSLQDIRQYLGFEPDFVVGNHGLEGIPGWRDQAENYQVLCTIWEEKLTMALQDKSVFEPGIWIENKRYSLTIHYRPVRDQSGTAQRLIKIFTLLNPSPRVVSGKSVFNLLPQDATDKGAALAYLMTARGFRSAIYVGDDITDEDVFRLRRRDVLTIRIEHADDSDAEFFLPQRSDIGYLLDELIERLRALQQKKHG